MALKRILTADVAAPAFGVAYSSKLATSTALDANYKTLCSVTIPANAPNGTYYVSAAATVTGAVGQYVNGALFVAGVKTAEGSQYSAQSANSILLPLVTTKAAATAITITWQLNCPAGTAASSNTRLDCFLIAAPPLKKHISDILRRLVEAVAA